MAGKTQNLTRFYFYLLHALDVIVSLVRFPGEQPEPLEITSVGGLKIYVASYLRTVARHCRRAGLALR